MPILSYRAGYLAWYWYWYQVPGTVVLGTNGTLGKGAQKFFSLLCREMVSYGRIPAWYFWSNILPDFMSNLDRGAHDLHLCWNRKRLNSQNPASIRLFDRTTRLGLEGSNRISYSGSRPQTGRIGYKGSKWRRRGR